MSSFIWYSVIWLSFIGSIVWIFSLSVRSGNRADGDMS